MKKIEHKTVAYNGNCFFIQYINEYLTHTCSFLKEVMNIFIPDFLKFRHTNIIYKYQYIINIMIMYYYIFLKSNKKEKETR